MKPLLSVATAIVALTIPNLGAAADTPAQLPSNVESFRHFARRFFLDPAFQAERVRFPLEWRTLLDAPPSSAEPYIEKVATKTRAQWQHLEGPPGYRCKSDCFDVTTYDNFGKRESRATERVIAYEGVDNGISVAMYFQAIDGKWMLIRYVDSST